MYRKKWIYFFRERLSSLRKDKLVIRKGFYIIIILLTVQLASSNSEEEPHPNHVNVIFAESGNSPIGEVFICLASSDEIDSRISAEVKGWSPPRSLWGGNATNFTLKPMMTMMRCELTVTEITWDPSNNRDIWSDLSITNETSSSASSISLFDNGTLAWIDLKRQERWHNPGEFCMEQLSSDPEAPIKFQVCLPTVSEQTLRIRKCCKRSEIIKASTSRTCIPASPNWEPIFYQEPNHKADFNPIPDFEMGFPQCEIEKTYIVQPTLDKKLLNLLVTGELVLLTDAGRQIPPVIKPEEFCIDGYYDSPVGNGTGTVVPYGRNDEKYQIAYICTTGEKPVPKWMGPLYAIVNHTAAFFLFLTAIVYLILWRSHNVHGWLQFSYVVSLFFSFNFLAIVQTWSLEIKKFSENSWDICAGFGSVIHLTFLSAFFWLTSMNFDLWWRFSGRRYLLRSRSRPCKENLMRFLLFGCFSLGFPLLISGSALTMDYIYRDTPDLDWIELPRFGKQRCYFQTKKSEFPFLYLPLGILLAIDLIFFASTVVHLRKIHTNTELARNHSTLEDKKGVRLIAKLFVVMGVLWIFEFLSWAAHVCFNNNPNNDNEMLLMLLFMPTEILNSLQGVAIFVIFVCKPNVLNQVRSKFNWMLEEKTQTTVSGKA